MPRLELNFLSKEPTDKELLLQLVYGLCGQINDPREENSKFFVSAVGIPNPYIRQLAKLLVTQLNLPITPERVDAWIEWQRTNHCWIVNEEMAAEAQKLSS